ncbi:MAG: PIN domain-containing protein [Acidobacteriota bacterium]
MRFDVTIIRIVFIVALVGAGYFLKPINGSQTSSVATGAIIALAIIFFEARIRKASLKTLIGGAVGSILGIAGATLICWIISLQHSISEEFKSFLTVAITLIMAYVGLVVGAVKGDYLDLSALGGIFVEKGQGKAAPLILDTSVIIDGRVADIADTGFLAGTLVIPQFVLKELQQIADSADSNKRNRGRRGLDILQRLQKKKGTFEIVISEADYPDVREVDHKLIELAKQIEGKIVTNDFNLNKVAQLRGVQVLNINELANALKPVVLPGELMRVYVMKEGKEYNQGVAYLDDGTMVVIDNARRMIGKNVDVAVTSVLQTTAGKMIFGRFNEDGRATVREEVKAPTVPKQIRTGE